MEIRRIKHADLRTGETGATAAIPKTHRRLVAVSVSFVLLRILLSPGRWPAHEVLEGVPADARLVDARFDRLRESMVLYFEHDDFAEVEPGALTPYRDVIIRRWEEK